jgi:cysteine synthase A
MQEKTMTGISDSILDEVGNTPVVRINRIAPPHVEMFVKVEAFNPLGSVKDRLAVGLIEAAERDGSLKPGQTVIEATSGNTGIGLAMVCAAKGYPLVIVMAENFSIERRKLLRFLGARVILTPAAAKGSGMLAAARQLAERNGWFLCRQFESEANTEVHSRTTAVEILDAFGPGGLDYWVSGFGTGGTLKGVARVLRRQSPGTRIIACEPDNSPLLGSGIRQAFDHAGQPAGSHPKFRPHLMQGWSPDFVSKLADDVISEKLVDDIVGVDGNDALQCARELARSEGIFCGISSGATFAAALEVARSAPAGSRILAMLPDTGERYLSTALFADVAEGMTDEESSIASDISYSSTPAKANEAASGMDDDSDHDRAAAFVKAVISDPTEPVVMFALAWCEFCWSVRKLFDKAGIAYRTVDLDSPGFQEQHDAEAVRAVLREMTGVPTIPQVFVGGEHVGGCSETFDAHVDGSLYSRLADCGAGVDRDGSIDPCSFLPNWVSAA